MIKIDIIGEKELKAAVQRLPLEMLGDIKDESDYVAEAVVLPNIRKHLRKHHKYSQTGELSRSLYIKKRKINTYKSNLGKATKYNAIVAFKRDGASIVPLELGHKLVIKGKTVKMIKEHPFMRPGADDSQATVNRVIIGAIQKTIARMGGLK